ncbi:MAG: serine/threonine protein kinase [Planctomycetes bacterium]|nr:serine/threonine protein kinase [Planctomycetota bacterium]
MTTAPDNDSDNDNVSESVQLIKTLSQTVADEDLPLNDVTTDGVISIECEHILSPYEDTGDARFQTGEILGSGGNGAVYNLIDNNLERTVAIKVLTSKHNNDPNQVKKIIHEALITSRLDHPHIPPIYDLDRSSEEQIYYTMKKIDGLPLSILSEKSTADYNQDELNSYTKKYDNIHEIVNIFTKVGEAVAYAHDKNIIHRDIKPSNIMLGAYGEVSLVDWGIAIDLINDEQKKASSGTPLYMSPEQARGELANEKSDIYCLGTSLYHILFKQCPFSTESADTFWDNKREGIIREPSEKQRRMAPQLLAICMTCMAANPDDRYSSADEFVQELKRFQSGAHIGAYRYSFSELIKDWIKHNKSHVLWSSILLLFALVGGTLAYQQYQREYAGWGSPILTEDFSSAESWGNDWLVTNGSFIVIDDELRTDTGPEFLTWYNKRIHGSIRFECDSKIIPGAQPGDLTIMYSPDTENRLRDAKTPVDIYYFQNGGYENTSSTIKSPHGRLDYTAKKLKSDKNYRIRVDIDGKDLRMYLNNELICSSELLFPLDSGYIGIYGFYSGKSFDNISISNKELPEMTPIMSTGDLLYEKGLYELAIERYQKIHAIYAQSDSGSDKDDESRFKMGLCHHKLGHIDEAFRIWDDLTTTKFRDQINFHKWNNDIDHHKYDDVLQEMHMLYAASSEKTHKQIQEQWAALLSEASKNWNPPLIQKLLDFRSSHFPSDQMFSRETFIGLVMLGDCSEAMSLFPSQENIILKSLISTGAYQEVIEKYPHKLTSYVSALLDSGQYEKIITDHSDLRQQYFLALLHSGQFERIKNEFNNNKKRMGKLSILGLGNYNDALENYDKATGSLAQVLLGDIESFLSLATNDDKKHTINHYDARLSMAMRAFYADHSTDSESDSAAIKNAIKDINGTIYRYSECLFPHIFLDSVFDHLSGNKKLCREKLDAMYAAKNPHMGMRQWYCCALLLGQINKEEFLQQPKQIYIEGDLLFYQALHQDLYGDPAQAKQLYKEYQQLPTYKKSVRRCLIEFVQFRINAL